jgi:hypothetical protein
MMMDESVARGSPEYMVLLCALVFSRGTDFLSTYVATPSLALEANPLAKKLGWKLGGLVNIALCLLLAEWPLTAIIICTASLLVAARNFQLAWLMRTMGENYFRVWFMEKVFETPLSLYLSCLLAQTALTSLSGVALLWFDGVPMAIGIGIVAYAVTVLFYTLLSLWRSRRAMG